jgi:hypothetical protein
MMKDQKRISNHQKARHELQLLRLGFHNWACSKAKDVRDGLWAIRRQGRAVEIIHDFVRWMTLSTVVSCNTVSMGSGNWFKSHLHQILSELSG